MNAQLAAFRHDDDRPPSAYELRRLVEYLEGLRGPVVAALARPAPPTHPYRVTPARDERTTYGPATEGRSWLLTLEPGTVDDRPVSILYQRQGDVRDWTPPADAKAPVGYPFADRTLFDQDDPPPQLLILAPKFGGKLGNDDLFTPVLDASRPVFFRTEDMWAFDLYEASVILSPDTSYALPPGTQVPLLGPGITTPTRRVRAHVHRVPTVEMLVNGTVVEVARLYLLRDPQADGGAQDDQVMVRQALYWNLQSVVVTLTEDVGTFDPFNPLVEVTDGQEVLFWTA